MKRYLNKDYQIYKFIGESNSDYTTLVNFKISMWMKYADFEYSKGFKLFGMYILDVSARFLESDFNIMFVSGEPDSIIIGNDETDIISFFEENAPLHLFKKCKRIIGLQSFGTHREELKTNLYGSISYMCTHEGKLMFENIEINKRRMINLNEIIKD